jgi:hypothetical protein
MAIPKPESLATRYKAGMTLRQIGAEIGRAHTTVRYHLRKLPGYRRAVTTILLKRLREAQGAYNITRAPENRRKMKHALAMLQQRRPEILARMIERSKPKRCAECNGAIDARLAAGLWSWRCRRCGEAGIIRSK